MNSQAVCDEETSLFTDSDWKSFNEKEKEDILQNTDWHFCQTHG